MKVRTTLTFAWAAALLGACSQSPSAPTLDEPEAPAAAFATATRSTRAADDAELNQLTQRVLDLKTAVTAAGRITLTHQLELDRLRAAVTSWQSRTGRADIAVSTPQYVRRSAVAGSGTGSCDACPIVHTDSPGKVCFLIEQGGCTPIDYDNWTMRVCAYFCFDIKALQAAPIGPPTRR